MIDWLRRGRPDPQVEIDGRNLPLAIRRHPTARRMTLRLAPDGSEVRITLPRWGRTAEALEFARSRRDWLAGQMAKIPSIAPPQPGGWLLYRGAEIAIAWDPKAPRRPELEAGTIRIGGPAENLPARLRRWLEAEALRLMADDLAFYCTVAGRAVPDLRLSRAQRRWGSCAGDRTIRINWRLVQASDAVRRSVVAHEVAHLVHFDHGPAFHALLGEIFEGEIKPANRWLKAEGRSLYKCFG